MSIKIIAYNATLWLIFVPMNEVSESEGPLAEYNIGFSSARSETNETRPFLRVP